MSGVTAAGPLPCGGGSRCTRELFYRANGYEVLRRATAWDGSAYLEMSKRL